MPAILMHGSLLDSHVQRVFDELRGRNQLAVEVIDFRSTTFEMNFESDGPFSLAVDARPLPDDLIIFDRAVRVPGGPLYPVGEDRAMGFGAEEWRALYRLIAAFYGDRVLNSLRSRECLAKPFHQIVAAQSGLKVPATLLTNGRAASLRFADAAPGHLVMKSLSGMKARPAHERDIIPYNVRTMRVKKSDIEGVTDGELAFWPHFLQHEIKKQYELRVIWVDGVVQAFKVDSQKLKCSETDWRSAAGSCRLSHSSWMTRLSKRSAPSWEAWASFRAAPIWSSTPRALLGSLNAIIRVPGPGSTISSEAQ